MVPGYTAIGRLRVPKAAAVAFPCSAKPSQTTDAVGMPNLSTSALARTTAGVQLPQQPIPDMTASHLFSFNVSRKDEITLASPPPCVLPNTL